MEIDDIKKSLHKLAFEVNSAVLLSAYKADYKIPPKSDFAMSYDNIDDSILCGKVLKGIFILKNLWNERTEEEAYKEAYKYLSVLGEDFPEKDRLHDFSETEQFVLAVGFRDLSMLLRSRRPGIPYSPEKSDSILPKPECFTAEKAHDLMALYQPEERTAYFYYAKGHDIKSKEILRHCLAEDCISIYDMFAFAEKGEALACEVLGDYYLMEKDADFDIIEKYYLKAVELGRYDHACEVADMMYSFGCDMLKDDDDITAYIAYYKCHSFCEKFLDILLEKYSVSYLYNQKMEYTQPYKSYFVATACSKHSLFRLMAINHFSDDYYGRNELYPAPSYDDLPDYVIKDRVLKGIHLSAIHGDPEENYRILSILEGDFEGKDNIQNMGKLEQRVFAMGFYILTNILTHKGQENKAGKLINSVAKRFTDDYAKDIAENTLDNYKKTLFGGYKYKYENKP